MDGSPDPKTVVDRSVVEAPLLVEGDWKLMATVAFGDEWPSLEGLNLERDRSPARDVDLSLISSS